MFNQIIRNLTKLLLGLRYRIKLKGVSEVEKKGKGKILFLPNHPAYIDPVILYAHLHKTFQPVGFGDQKQIDRPLIGLFARQLGVRSLPSIAEQGSAAREEVRKKIEEGAEQLEKGRNVILWPSGTTYKSRYESLGANSAADSMIKNCPDCRVVLIRTWGLWGSGFSWAGGEKPNIPRLLLKVFPKVLANLILFTPRREVTIELFEPDDIPRQGDRREINRYIENFYNRDAPPNLYVPYTIWEKLAGGKVKELADPTWEKEKPDTTAVANSTRESVINYLKELAGVDQIRDEDHLAIDLGLDSLSRTDITLWVEKEFGRPQPSADALETVGDVMLAASGQFFHEKESTLKQLPKRWFRERPAEKLELPAVESVNQTFLAQARKKPGNVVVADQISGEKTYRQVITSCLALQPALQALEKERVGIMMPASVGAAVIYLATLFAGKTPVMLNWTLGAGPAAQCLDSVDAGKVITSKKVFERVQAQGFDFSSMQERFLFLEDVATEITLVDKLKAFLSAYGNWTRLSRIKPPGDAAILFTSGSETIPKAVPLTHANILANIGDVIKLVDIGKQDKFIGFLPPFHSFGLTCTILVPVLCGARVVFHANPMETKTISQIIAAYQVDILMGTPTFLNGILKGARENQLESLRLAVTGAEKCPDEVYEKISESCPKATVLEGYGVTECSPIVALNDQQKPVQGSIGRILPSFEYKLLDPDTREPVSTPGRGVLVVRGPSVFRGYLNDPGKELFVELAGKKWYDTGDLVYEDENKVLFFQARLKRFIKIGGEMISLPAIEATLNSVFAQTEDEPVLAIEANETKGEPEIVLFTTKNEINREKANAAIRDAGMSGLQHIRKVEKIEEIPVLGTGKIDYRSLKKKIRDDDD